MDRLSPMSTASGDSGIHSLSSPATPQKKRPATKDNEWTEAPKLIPIGLAAKEQEDPPEKKPRLEVKDGWVPRSIVTSEESLERTPTPVVEVQPKTCEESVLPNDICDVQPSTSSSLPCDECSQEPSNSHLEESEEQELVNLQDFEITVACEWDVCQQRFTCVNQLYDHVVAVHMEEQEAKNCDSEDIECLWKDCDMSLSRGDWKKKVNWLRDHYRTRHAKLAQTFKCLMEDCSFRSMTSGQLEEHIRGQHLLQKKKQIRIPKPKTENWFGWQQRHFWPRWPGSGKFSLGRSIDQKIQDVLCSMSDMEWKCEVVPRKRHGLGAYHRKCRRSAGFEVVGSPSKSFEEKDQEEESDIDTSYLNKTLDDLFPGYHYEENKKLSEEREKLYQNGARKRSKEEKRLIVWNQEEEKPEMALEEEVDPI